MTTPTPPSALPDAVAWVRPASVTELCAWRSGENANRTASVWADKGQYATEPLYTAPQLSARDAQWREVVEGLRVDAERFRALQEMPPIDAQAFFWAYASRKQRAAAIDAARAKEADPNAV